MMDHRATVRRYGVIVTALMVLIFAQAAMAFETGGDFSCSAGRASGQLYLVEGCPATLSKNTFFSFLICNLEHLASDVMGAMYCGIIDALAPMVWAAATLAITLFGASFMLGITQVGRGAAILFVIKIAFVTGFALNADLLIGVAYRLLITIMHEGSAIALSVIKLPPSSSAAASGTSFDTPLSLYAYMDQFGAKWFNMVTDMIKGTGATAGTDPDARCTNALIAVLGTMLVAFPLLGYLGLALIARIAMGVFSAVFGYIYALIGVTFLIILAPFFLCFYLFKQTQPFFDKWVGYLASFTIQALLLFTFMSFVLSLDVSRLTGSFKDLVMFKDEAVQGTAVRYPWEYCTVCDFEAVDTETGAVINPSDNDFFGKTSSVEGSGGATLRCKMPKTAIKISMAQSPKSASDQLSALINVGAGTVLALIVIVWLAEHLLKLIPSVAQRLGAGLGASAAPQLGSGEKPYAVTVDMPGTGVIDDFKTGFRTGYGYQMHKDGIASNTVSSSIQGLKDGMSTMITGKDTKGRQLRPGISERYKNWLGDPAAFSDRD